MADVDRDGPAAPESGGRWDDDHGDVTQLSDGGLVVAIAQASHDALAEAYSRHGARVHGLARRVCGQDRAGDVVQEVFLRLWREPERFDQGRGSLRSFLLMQAHGRSVALLRSDSARRARESASLARRRATGTEVDDAVLARLAGHDAWRLLSRLGDGERQAIALAYFGHHTYREVAELLDQPEGTVKSRIRSGLARLRTELYNGGN